MYSFYETIKQEVDLQDLVDYLNNPLNQLKLLQIKLQEYKEQHNSENKIEIEELIRETEKLEKSLFPDLINNYCKLSLEFRNNTVIKESKDKQGNTVAYTSKDLLLKNIAKLIEHIHLLDEKFYKYFSFEFLVNSRIISDLGYQENYLDKNYEPVVLKNQYVFSKDDAKKIIDKQLGKNNQKINNPKNNNEKLSKLDDKKAENIIEKTQLKGLVEAPLDFIDQPQVETKSITNVADLLQNKVEDSEENNVIFEKKSQPVVEKNLPNNNTETSSAVDVSMLDVVFSMLEIVLFITLILGFGVSVIYNKISEGTQKHEQKIQQEKLIAQIKEQNKNEVKEESKSSQDVLKELAENKEKNKFIEDSTAEDTYRTEAILMTQMIEWKKLAQKSPFNNEKISFNALNGFQTHQDQMLVSATDMIHNGKAYHIDVVDGKAQLKTSNISQNECKYSALKFNTQYDMQTNDNSVNPDNMNSVCLKENKLTITEK